MTYLVTIGRYRAITGDRVTDAITVSANIEAAQEALEDVLDRPLAEAEYTETLHPTRDGMLWPRATPIVAADGYTIDGHGLYGGTGTYDMLVDHPTSARSVTYTGGWVERTANPTADNRLPAMIERDLAQAAYAMREPEQDASGIPAGARSVSIDGAAVTFGPDGAPAAADGAPRWSRGTLAYRYRILGGVTCSRW